MMALDPVCGMTVDPRSAAGSASHEGKTYWFCSPHCAAAFKSDPAKYLGFGAFVYNTVGIPVAALGFLNPIIAAAAMALLSLSVVANSALLKAMKLERI